MSTGANYLDVGGETSGDGVSPPMGNGNKPPNRLVAMHGGVSYGPKSGGAWRGPTLNGETTSPYAVQVTYPQYGNKITTQVAFGGPGGTNC